MIEGYYNSGIDNFEAGTIEEVVTPDITNPVGSSGAQRKKHEGESLLALYAMLKEKNL
jgi:hypothetical protein